MNFQSGAMPFGYCALQPSLSGGLPFGVHARQPYERVALHFGNCALQPSCQQRETAKLARAAAKSSHDPKMAESHRWTLGPMAPRAVCANDRGLGPGAAA